jgi:hypothetical protein
MQYGCKLIILNVDRINLGVLFFKGDVVMTFSHIVVVAEIINDRVSAIVGVKFIF